MELQKTSNNQNNFEKGEQSWQHHIPDFNLYCKQYAQNNMLLAQKQTHRSMEHY